ncbi:MAG: tRNA (adenosine(37)-N6)-threonylcarbamoyltransferase complex transferase subunit TsaD [Verrucomicrobia bacterium]|nr:MAG: tRNA (adenosine(37)-N6)-threonylcarbamoyltransferase complex transferase subunit TsaD [Verrucomicrobiota bacterium]
MSILFEKKVLALETSCDETAVAILKGFGGVLFHSILSQADVHAQYGGVVPEVASRSHLEVLPSLVQKALQTIPMDEIDLYAATVGPGLASALMVGAYFAQAMALGVGKPFAAVNHIEGHLLSPFFGQENVPPHIALIVSGGHTLLLDVHGVGDYVLLGKTQDDAAGEAFDKVAKFLGLPYPGGVQIDALAKQGNPALYSFPRSMLHSGDLNFSFSGLKTAIRVFLKQDNQRAALPDLCASFQEAIVDVLTAKTLRAALACSRTLIAVSGGVSSNSRLQTKLADACLAKGIALRFAESALRTDNALMIAFAAIQRINAGLRTPNEIMPNLELESLCKIR